MTSSSPAKSYRHLGAILLDQADRLGPRPALRYKRHGWYHDITWAEYRDKALACAAALLEAGVQPGDRVGLVSPNCVEWLLADMGTLLAGAVMVPGHILQSASQIQDQFRHAEVSWVFASNHDVQARLTKPGIPSLRGVIAFDTTWTDFLQRGRTRLVAQLPQLRQRLEQLTPEHLATIMYTSGTTGNSKGVMLTHGNLASNACSIARLSDVGPEAVILNWLPFSHIYARTVDHYQSLTTGYTLCLSENQDTLVEDLRAIRPHVFASVPRFYEKLLETHRSASETETSRKLRDIFGPRIAWMNSGGAPLPSHVAQAFRAAELPLFPGYGLTETAPVITLNRRDRAKVDSVGQVIDQVEVKIAADGEILTRGPNVMKGYWKDQAATEAAIVAGWFHTGDLGTLDADGFLTIQGRKKDLLVLSNGKKVVPTQLEALILADGCVEQVLVYGEGKNFLTALVVPAFEPMRQVLQARGMTVRTRDDLVAQPMTGRLIEESLNRALSGLSNWEQVRRFVLVPQPFSQTDDEVTVSLKLRRGVILKKYADRLERLYSA
jgi:long-chain acyl-CoA synthetase